MFNPSSSTIMHIDLNSCFASIEQQANPLLRGKSMAVAAYTTEAGCILAPSVEAKKLGIKVGMRVKEGKSLCPNLIVLAPDPWKYRFVNRKLLALLKSYTPNLSVRSIDEMVVNFAHTDHLERGMLVVAKEIKTRIKKEIGDWLTVSVGIAPNRYLAKTAASLNKPDGLDEINCHNFNKVYRKLKLTDLCGIKTNNMVRLNSAGIFSVYDMYRASLQKLKSAFKSIAAYYWYLRLRGYEIDDIEWARKSFGQSYALYKATSNRQELAKLLCHLVTKMGRRLRFAGYTARGIHLSCLYQDRSFWHHGHTFAQKMYATGDLYKCALKILNLSPYKKVRTLSVACFALEKNSLNQLTLFDKEQKKRVLTAACDRIWDKWGNFSIIPATMMGTTEKILDRIAFGGIKELEEVVFR